MHKKLEDVSWKCPFNNEEIPVVFHLSRFGSIEYTCLKAHNDRRALHGASPLIWDDTLAQQAQVWADHLAATAKMRHDPDLDEEGENLAWFQGRLTADCTDALVGWWVNWYWHFGLKFRFEFLAHRWFGDIAGKDNIESWIYEINKLFIDKEKWSVTFTLPQVRPRGAKV